VEGAIKVPTYHVEKTIAHIPLAIFVSLTAESLFEESKAIDLYGVPLLDGSIGEAVFGDPARMHRDLLADATAAYLPKLLPSTPKKESK
jgi:hypothetical protein